MSRVTRALPVALLATVVVTAQAPSTDDARAAWRYRRDVVRPAGVGDGFLAVPLPPEVVAKSQRGLADVRLIDASGRETPYVVVEDVARDEVDRMTGRLSESREERRLGSTWTLDLGRPVSFDGIELELPGRDFAKRFAVEASADGTTWLVLDEGFWAFDRLWNGRQIHDTGLDLPAPTTARFLRFTADDTRSAPLPVRGAAAIRRRSRDGSLWNRQVALTPVAAAAGRSRYSVPVPAGYPVRRIEIDADDASFARPLTVLTQREGQTHSIGRATVYRLRLPESGADVDARRIELPVTDGELLVEIEDGDSPPLTNPRLTLFGPQTQLLVGGSAPALTLYYGNPVTRRAVYDLERLRPQLASAAGLPAASLGDEVANPRFRPPVPLAFVPGRGAAVQSARWRFTRPLTVQGADDLYTLTLDPGDVARGRADLADLRLVDAADRQVPFVLERDVETATLTLEAVARPASGRARTSAWTLRVPQANTGGPVTVSGLELRLGEAFFRRTATVAVPAADAPLGRRAIATMPIASADREGTTGAVIRLAIGPTSAAELTLEVEDGDNAPLTLVSAVALAPVPRLTFKASAGDYRLLFGNDQAQPPSYELDQLRQEVLDYAAVPVPVQWLAATAATPGARSLTGLMREPPATAVLWGALGLAVVVLLALTRRILRDGSVKSES